MIFRNLKSGNLVSVNNKDSMDLMKRSAIYEEVHTESKEKVTKKKKT